MERAIVEDIIIIKFEKLHDFVYLLRNMILFCKPVLLRYISYTQYIQEYGNHQT